MWGGSCVRQGGSQSEQLATYRYAEEDAELDRALCPLPGFEERESWKSKQVTKTRTADFIMSVNIRIRAFSAEYVTRSAAAGTVHPFVTQPWPAV